MPTPFQNRAIRALAESVFFGELDAESIPCIHRTAVRRGEVLFEKGDPSEHLFGVVSGQLKAYSTPSPGREISLDLIAPGELVGQLWVTDGGPRHAAVKALAPSELATISRNDLVSLLAERPELSRSLGSASASTVGRLAERAEDVAFLSVEARLEKILVDLGDRMGEAVERGTRIRLRQRDLAEMLGVTRESVNRALTSPAMQGKLELGRGSIVLRGRVNASAR
jgi:CRP-like cAMP-binding protein